MSYPDWLAKANTPNGSELQPDKPHWYFKLDGKSQSRRDSYLFDELPFFNPTDPKFYMVDPPADGRLQRVAGAERLCRTAHVSMYGLQFGYGAVSETIRLAQEG